MYRSEKRVMKRLLGLDFVRFCIVGGLGFGINLAFLAVFYRVLHFPIFWSQLIAAEIALFNNFMLHHHWTYKDHNVEKTIINLIIQFHVTSWVAILGSAVLVSVGVKYLHMHYFVALVISSIIALGWNYGWTKYVIWKKHHHKEGKEIEE